MISIIIPAYDRADLLKKTLKSIKSQVITVDYEIIIIDDCSSNNDIEMLAAKHNCRYFKNNKNMGAQYSRNFGVENASYEYIAFLDSDDIWESSNKLIKQYNILKNNTNISLVYTNINYIDEFDNFLYKNKSDIKGVVNNSLKSILLKDFVATYSSVMVRKKDFISCGMCDLELPARQDWDLWIRLSKLGNFYRLDDVYISYRLHSNQISSNVSKKLIGYEKLILKNINDYSEHKYALFVNLIKIFLLSKFSDTKIQNLQKVKIHNRLIYVFSATISTMSYYMFKLPLINKKIKNSYLFKGI
jgi:glycosyltransferase involved in cell wall biosynthesis